MGGKQRKSGNTGDASANGEYGDKEGFHRKIK